MSSSPQELASMSHVEAWGEKPGPGLQRRLIVEGASAELRIMNQELVTPQMIAALDELDLPVERTKIIKGQPLWAEVHTSAIPELLEERGLSDTALAWTTLAEQNASLNGNTTERDRDFIYFVIRNSGKLLDVKVQPVPENS